MQRFGYVLSLALALFLTSVPDEAGARPANPASKVLSVVLNAVEQLESDGVTAANARFMSVRQRYESPLNQFDDQGRIGLILDVESATLDLVDAVYQYGGRIVVLRADLGLVSVFLPIDRVLDIASLDNVLLVRSMTTAVVNTGSITSEGDSIHHAQTIRTDLNVQGDSIRVGVISDGCTNWAISKGFGDLPAGYVAANHTFLNGNKIGAGDEGTAMMEIVYDLAPRAQLFFYGALGAGGGSATMVDAITRLRTEKGCDVIVDDLTYFDQPMFEDQTVTTAWTIAAAARQAVDSGVVYVSSAGNWAAGGSTDRSHYQANWSDANVGTPVPPPMPPPPPPKVALPNGPILPPFPVPFDNLHMFGMVVQDVGLRVTTPAASVGATHLVVVLEWNDSWGFTNNDFDLYIYDKNLNVKRAQSINTQDGAGFQIPYESIALSHEPYPETLNVVINHYSSGAPPGQRLLGLYIYGVTSVEYNTPQNSIWGQPGAREVIAVGAVPYNNIATNESYSSRGNYDVYFPAYASRPKPDVMAVDGNVITGTGNFGFWDGANWRFYGTSASAPHVAGMAALVLSRCPELKPLPLQAKLSRTAVDLGVPGFDVIFGNGRADAERAMLELDTVTATQGPDTLLNTTNVPMFFATPDGYAMNTVTITGGVWQPNSVISSVMISSGNPYNDAGIVDLGCPTVRRWSSIDQTAGIPGGYTSRVTLYVHELERTAAGIAIADMRIVHWNGKWFDILPQFAAPSRVADTWKIQATYNPASGFVVRPEFFVGHLTRSVDVAALSNVISTPDTTVRVAFTVGNTGNGWDTLGVHMRDSRGWTLAPADTGIALSKSEQDTLSVRVTIPAGTSFGTTDTLWCAVRSWADGTSKDSSFAIITVQMVPGAVVLVSPEDGALFSGGPVQCVWRKALPAVTKYWLEWAGDSLFTSPSRDSTLTDTTGTISVTSDGTYWWRVRAKNTAGWGAWSSVRHFIQSVNAVDQLAGIPTEFKLHQNFPNPFNPVTAIRFELPKAVHVRLTVYNLLGQEVLALLEDERPAGIYETSLDASQLASGVYFYRLEAGSFVATKKLTIVR